MLKDRPNLDSLPSLWSYTDEVDWAGNEFFQPGYILASLNRQPLILSDVGGWDLPPR